MTNDHLRRTIEISNSLSIYFPLPVIIQKTETFRLSCDTISYGVTAFVDRIALKFTSNQISNDRPFNIFDNTMYSILTRNINVPLNLVAVITV